MGELTFCVLAGKCYAFGLCYTDCGIEEREEILYEENLLKLSVILYSHIEGKDSLGSTQTSLFYQFHSGYVWSGDISMW